MKWMIKLIIVLVIILPCYADTKEQKKSPIELSWGNSMYQKQYPKATTLFYHPNDWSSFQGGLSVDGINSYAGFVGVTFNLPWFKKKY